MHVAPEQILAIAGLVISSTQLLKRAYPGDIDNLGPLLSGIFSLFAVLAWVYQYHPTALTTDFFDIAVLVASVYTAATGGYTVARQATSAGGRQFARLRATRDAEREEAAA